MFNLDILPRQEPEKPPDAVELAIAAEKRAHPERTAANEKIMAEIDFGLMRGIYARIAAQYGVDPAILNFIMPERISFGFSATTSYDAERQAMDIDFERQREVAKAWGLPTLFVAVLVLAHEEGHAISQSVCLGTSSSAGKEKTAGAIRVGFTEKVDGPIPILYRLPDEGANEELAREVALEYLKACGKADSKDIEKLEKWIAANDGRLHYSDTVNLWRLMMERIGKVAEKDPEAIRHTFRGSRLHGKDLGKDPILRDLILQALPKGFLGKLRTGQREWHVDDMISAIEEMEATQ